MIASVGLVAVGLLTGAVLAGTHIAGAQSSTPSPSATSHAPGHAGETALTGTTAAKVKAAALKAVPGGTVLRVETDSDGSPYEAHVRKADGTHVVVKVDKNFNVTSIGTCGAGHHDRSNDSTDSSTNAA